MIEDRGELEIDAFDDANVPVDIWLTKLDLDSDDEEVAEGFTHVLRIGNYMPRKARVEGGSCEIFADNKEELQALVKDKVLPIYNKAIAKINGIIDGSNISLYYWNDEVSKDED